ncbi:MAG: ATP-binding cassette domain-containing protein, partial [Chloroflexi bacterium]|nr:ATP-binding cassette domain-containing protein [Chloroflexota bacterium]
MSQPIHVSTAQRTSAPALSVQGLTITYQAKRGDVQAVRNVSFDVGRGEALAIIGESGSGKTTLGLGIVRLLPSTATIRQGELLYRRFGAAGNGGGTSA